MASLCHDIGYVLAVCRVDGECRYATGIGDETVEIPDDSTDSVLPPYHVDRSKLIVRERLGNQTLVDIVDADRIAALKVSSVWLTCMPTFTRWSIIRTDRALIPKHKT